MKRHLGVLDGLRGTAAVSVVIFHFSELSIGLANPEGLWLRHAYLAVDFFFCLSGYVIGYAYDDRRDRMSIGQFMSARLMGLHPMVVAGLLLGLASFTLDPFSANNKAYPWMELQVAPVWKLVADSIGGVLMLPTWSLPNRFGSYFSLNSPAWSLMWEYVASIAFALLLWRMKRIWLIGLVSLGAIGLGVSAFDAKVICLGYGWGQALYGLARITFSFGAGLLLFRCGAVVRTRFGFGALSVIMVLLFVGPFSSRAAGNWIYELTVVVVVFPLIVAMGAGATASGLVGRICDLCGRISYPIYMTHYAFIMIFANYHWTHKISPDALPWVITTLTIGLVLFSYAVLVLYDEPIRRWLSQGKRHTKNGH